MSRPSRRALERYQESAVGGQTFEFANPMQEDFALCPTRESLMDGGVGSGKTIGGIIKLLMLAEAYPGSRWFVARQFYKDLIQTTRKTFQRFCPLDWPRPCPPYIWSTSNPAGKDWVYFRFHPDCSPPPTRAYFFAPTHINREVLNKYAPGYYDNLMRKSPSWRKRWVEGSRDLWEGQIFTEFNKKIHTYDPKLFDPYAHHNGGVSWAWMDYGLTKPTTCIISYTTPEGLLFITREYGAADKLIKDHATEIRNMIAVNPRPVRGIYADPAMFAQSTRDRHVLTTSIADEYRKCGVYLLKADNNEESSIEILHEMFHTRPSGVPTLRINADCKNLIQEIEMQRWDEERNPLTGEREFVQHRKETVADDYFDPLRYFANSKIHQVTAKRPPMKLPGYGWIQKEAGVYR